MEALTAALHGLSYLLLECSRLSISDLDFSDSLIVLGLPQEVNDELKQVYLENKAEIRRILSAMKVNLPSYSNLEWRLDVQIASRSLRAQVEPIYYLKLSLLNAGTRGPSYTLPSPLIRSFEFSESNW